jgi:choline dehydrogenase-like flavoprotein
VAEVLILGSGPASAAAALATLAAGRHSVRLLDIGEQLEAEKSSLLKHVADSVPSSWPKSVLGELAQHPTAEVKGELPQKRIYGSDFPFRDRGQLERMTTSGGGNRYTVSPAFGGFSNVWGAQVMPFSERTFDEWPIPYRDLLPHYRAILAHIPLAGTDDDYSELFPLLGRAEPLPRLAPSAAAALARYRRHSERIRPQGVTLGQARLALRTPDCIECGLCLTGCPYGLIYASSQTLSPLIAGGKIRYEAGYLVERVGQDEEGPWALARRVGTRDRLTFRGDHLFVGCGGLGTTRLVAASVRAQTACIELAESVQLVLPFLSARSQPDPRRYSTFTLNQFNILVEYGRPGMDLAQFHLYPYNPAFEDALPRLLRVVRPVRDGMLRRTVAALGYLPSWDSPRIRAQLSPDPQGGLPSVALSVQRNPATKGALSRVFRKLLRVAPALDLWPGLPVLTISGPAKSYHFGGSFPHVSGRPDIGKMETDILGRVAEWDRVHLVDGSVFPSVPATTFTLTVMANAHRIATAALAADP